MLINQENYSKFEVEQAKRDIQRLAKNKSKIIKIDLKKKEDIKVFFDDWLFFKNIKR